MMPAAVPGDSISAAMAHMIAAIDAYTPSADAGGLPKAATYPAADFNYTSGTSLDTGGRPALALAGKLNGSLQSLLSSWLGALGNSAANPAVVPAAPTHLCFGVRTHIDTPVTTARSLPNPRISRRRAVVGQFEI